MGGGGGGCNGGISVASSLDFDDKMGNGNVTQGTDHHIVRTTLPVSEADNESQVDIETTRERDWRRTLLERLSHLEMSYLSTNLPGHDKIDTETPAATQHDRTTDKAIRHHLRAQRRVRSQLREQDHGHDSDYGRLRQRRRSSSQAPAELLSRMMGDAFDLVHQIAAEVHGKNEREREEGSGRWRGKGRGRGDGSGHADDDGIGECAAYENEEEKEE